MFYALKETIITCGVIKLVNVNTLSFVIFSFSSFLLKSHLVACQCLVKLANQNLRSATTIP